jgi:hypothetical protein
MVENEGRSDLAADHREQPVFTESNPHHPAHAIGEDLPDLLLKKVHLMWQEFKAGPFDVARIA